MRRPSACVLSLALVALSGPGCKNNDVVAAPLPPEEAPRRAANSFIHCVESGTSLCVRPGETVGGWDAFFLLTWLGGGSPLSILSALPRELAAHADPDLVQDRFVEEVERYAREVRGAECDAADMQPIEPLIDQVGQVAADRLVRLGMWQSGMSDVVGGLVAEAHETMGGGYLVRMDCAHDPHRLWVATIERDDRQQVIGMTTLLPSFLGGQPPGREELSQRLRSRSLGLSVTQAPIVEGNVHPWIPVPVEEF